MKYLSIIIPFYNCPNELNRLLESIGYHDDVEIIVINDKSDKNLESFEKVKNKFSNCIFVDNSLDKKGAGVCRNIGLSIAKGKWLLFADSDDYFLKNWYLKVKRYFQSEVDIIYFRPDSSYNDNGRIIQYVKFFDNYLRTSNELNLRYSFYAPWSKLIRHDLVISNNVRYDETRYSNDVMFSIKTGFFAKDIIVDNNAIYCLTEDNSNSLTKQISFESLYIRSEVLCKAYCYLRCNLSKNDFEQLLFSIPLKTIIMSMFKYGFDDTWILAKLYRKYQVPLIDFNKTNMRKRIQKKMNKSY